MSRRHDGEERRKALREAADRAAAAAARQFEARGGSIEDAIDAVTEDDGRARPTANQVRQHLAGRAQERLGMDGYRRQLAAWLAIGLDAIDAIESAIPGCRASLAGRGAAGRLDGDPTLHLRVSTASAIGVIAAALVEAGFAEPTFETLNATCGRLDRLRSAAEGVEVVVVRCPPGQIRPGRVDLVTGRPTTVLEREALDAAIEDLRDGKDPFR